MELYHIAEDTDLKLLSLGVALGQREPEGHRRPGRPAVLILVFAAAIMFLVMVRLRAA